MDTQYWIQLTLKTGVGEHNLAKFFLGNERKTAYAIFQKLQGTDILNEGTMIFMDFMVTKNGLSVSADVTACTLDQLGENCKMITKELFKLNALSVSKIGGL